MELKGGFLRAVCKIKGESVNLLPEFAHKKGVAVINFLPISKTECLMTVDFSELYKIFAICKNMCYNVTVVRYKGVLSPLTLLIKHFTLVISGVLFTLITLFFSSMVLDVKVTGSGSCFANETKQVVSEFGVKKYTFFSKIDYNALETAILQSNPRLSFVTATKRGGSLVINTVLSTSPPSILGQNQLDLLSKWDGVVEEISVLRGTAIVKVGDKVKVNDLLVGAYLLDESGNAYPTYVVARVKILENKEYFYKCSEITDQAVSIAYALSEFYVDGEVASKSHKVIDGGIIVTTTIRRVIYGG